MIATKPGNNTGRGRRAFLPYFSGLLLLLLLAYTLALLVDFAHQVKPSVSYFLQGRDYQLSQRWQEDDYYRRVTFINQHTPANSLIVLPPQDNPYGAIGNAGLTDYFVFPRRNAHESDPRVAAYMGPVYGVKVQGFLSTHVVPPGLALDSTFGLTRLRESRGATEQAITLDFISIEPAVLTTLFGLLKLLLIVLTGSYLVQQLFGLRTIPGMLAASLLVGIIAETVVFVVLGLLGINATEDVQLLILAITAAPALVRLLRHPPLAAFRVDRADLISAVFAAILLALILLVAIARPMMEWDEAAIWGIKARAIFSTGSLRALLDWGAWKEYPPLVPVAMAQLSVATERAAKALFPLLAFCLYGTLYEGFETTPFPRRLRLLLPFPLLLTDQLLEHSQKAYANLALAAYVTLAVVLLARWLYADDRRLAIATAVALCGVVLARPDGEVYAAYCVVIAVGWQMIRQRSRRTLGVLLLPLAIDFLWKTFFLLHLRSPEAPPFSVAPQARELTELMLTTTPALVSLQRVGRYLATYMFSPAYWGLAPLLFVVVVFRSPREFTRRYGVESAFLVLSVGGLVALAYYLGLSWGVEGFFNGAFLRSYMAIVPVMYLLLIRELGTACAWRSQPQSA